MVNKFFKLVLWILCLILLFWIFIETFNCIYKKPVIRRCTTVDRISPYLKSGDLILFSNHSSNYTKNLRRKIIRSISATEWTHVGVIVMVGNTPWVWEVTPSNKKFQHSENQYNEAGFSTLKDISLNCRGYLGIRKRHTALSNEKLYKCCKNLTKRVRYSVVGDIVYYQLFPEKSYNYDENSQQPEKYLNCVDAIHLILSEFSTPDDPYQSYKGRSVGTVAGKSRYINRQYGPIIHLKPEGNVPENIRKVFDDYFGK